MKILLPFALILLFAEVTYGQCSTVKGMVLDAETEAVLPGATVYHLSDYQKGTTTDGNGEFSLSANVGSQIKLSFIGYEALTITVDSTCTALVRLVPLTTSLSEMTIRAERLVAEGFTISKLSKLNIYTNPGAKADPLLAVNTLPAATTLDESANISLRGADPAETGIFLNNVPINDAVRYAQLNGIGTFSIFNTAIINQMLVYPGNPPLEYGNTSSGLIALSTDEQVPDQNTNSLTFSLANIGFLSSRKLNEKSSLTAFTNIQPSAGIKFLNPASLERLKRFNTVDLGLHYLNRLSDRTLMKVFSYSNAESFSYETRQPTYTGNFDQEKWRTLLIFNLRHRLKYGELSLNNGINASSSRFQLSIIDTQLQLQDYYTSLTYQYAWQLLEVKTGITYDYRSTDFSGTLPVYGFALAEEHPAFNLISSRDLRTPEAFVYSTYHLSGKWQVGTGLRKNVFPNNQIDYLSSQVNLSYQPAAYWKVILSAGNYNKVSIAQDDYSQFLHYNSKQYALDISHKRTKIENSLSVYYKDGSRNELQTAVKGIEFYSRYQLPQKIRIEVAITSLDATQQSIQTDRQASRFDINYILRNTIEYKFLSTWTFATVFMRRQGSLVDPVLQAAYRQDLNAYEPVYGNPQRLPDYYQLDMSLTKLFLLGKNGTGVLFINTGNVPNFTNVRSYTYNFDYSEKSKELFSLRTFYIGVMLNF
jgi:CarboxypepD_reg-like domain/TonB-dependent Receptor Plug Domain